MIGRIIVRVVQLVEMCDELSSFGQLIDLDLAAPDQIQDQLAELDQGVVAAPTGERIVDPRATFTGTALESVLSDLDVGRLVVVGAETDACIRSTIHGAFARGYDTTLVSDAHTTNDQTQWGAPPPEQVIAHTNLYWTYQSAPHRTAGTVGTGDVDFG